MSGDWLDNRHAKMSNMSVSRRHMLSLGGTMLGAAAFGGTFGIAGAARQSGSDATPVAGSPGWPAETPDYTSLAAAVQGEAARWNIPGMTAAVLHNGERTAAASGVTNVEYPVPVTPGTGFQIGSISKVFTATAVMALVDQGKLDLDTPVWEWVPDLPIQRPDAYATLSLRHLLNHTTGFEGDIYFDMGNGDDALAAGIARFGEIRPWTKPGEVVAYCNTGFCLAGRIIELVTGQVYEDAIADLIFAPLGMERTSFPSTDLLTWPTSSGHSLPRREQGNIVARPWALPRFVNAAGGIVSTVDDLLTFAAMHMNDGAFEGTRILSPAATEEMRTRTSASDQLDEGYGVGWNIVHAGDVPLINHGGATNGFRAWLLTVPSHQFAIAMLTNSDEGLRATDALEQWALRHYLNLERTPPTATSVDTGELARVAGRYERHDGIIDVWHVDDHLHLEHRFVEHDDAFSTLESPESAPTALALWPAGNGVFVAPGGPPLESVVEFFDAPLFGAGADLEPRPAMRRGGRLAERTGDAPASGPTIPAQNT